MAVRPAVPPLDFDVFWPDGGTAVIALVGELDVAGAPRVRQAVVDVLDADIERVVVDLSGLSFIDSTGLGVLVGAYKRARAVGADFAVARPSTAVARVFQIAGIDKILPVEAAA